MGSVREKKKVAEKKWKNCLRWLLTLSHFGSRYSRSGFTHCWVTVFIHFRSLRKISNTVNYFLFFFMANGVTYWFGRSGESRRIYRFLCEWGKKNQIEPNFWTKLWNQASRTTFIKETATFATAAIVIDAVSIPYKITFTERLLRISITHINRIEIWCSGIGA